MANSIQDGKPAGWSIGTATGQIWPGTDRLELFKNRNDVTTRFLSYLNDDPPQKQILYFSGTGGMGKSVELDYLARWCCKRLSPDLWSRVRTGGSSINIRNLIGDLADATPLPFAYIGFDWQPQSTVRPKEPVSALIWLRSELSAWHIEFPLFDTAIVWYLHNVGRLTREELAARIPRGGDWLRDLADALAGLNPFGGMVNAVVRYFRNRCNIDDRFARYFAKRRLNDDRVFEAIARMEPHRELIDHLPTFLAMDLNEWVRQGQVMRIVLFFDSLEELYSESSPPGLKLRYVADCWLRTLLRNLDLSAGIVVVISGREYESWHRAPDLRKIPERFVEHHAIGPLASQAAMEYLSDFGISDVAARIRIAEVTSVASGQHHPLYLNLCAQTYVAAADGGRHPLPIDVFPPEAVLELDHYIVDHLLRHLPEEARRALIALSEVSAFGRDLFDSLGDPAGYSPTPELFEFITKLSVVQPADCLGPGNFQVHRYLRRLIRRDWS